MTINRAHLDGLSAQLQAIPGMEGLLWCSPRSRPGDPGSHPEPQKEDSSGDNSCRPQGQALMDGRTLPRRRSL